MARLEDIARTALGGDALLLRSKVQDWLRESPIFAEVARPGTADLAVLAVSAALAELFAARAHQAPPEWAAAVPALPDALFLVRSASTMRRLRIQCETESPLPLRRRNLFAPAEYLQFA